ncbi:PREDICTED: arfaptin-2-like isoform X15 [Branchiostoma belcheri]|uniref:Arfaptin-2-like isoform X13 n=1 Tax=Branchiostoma belcheri TaxID=7741 RepID=A0A6P4Z2J6_BRABE|nr:PREDICTED: arfaptin-2-like isoform X13 [Branchiostoma belcheri]XP_019625312.1 PREDICTED: arfaptin-2-like isoform X15 [Branchiostoma belcheri]
MTDATAPLTSEIPITSNGTPNDAAEDDTFERDLKKMLQDGPNLNNSSAVQGGSGTTPTTVAPTPFSGVRLNSPTAPSQQQQRSPTGPVPPPNPYVGSRLASTLKPPQYQAPGSTQELEDYEADEFAARPPPTAIEHHAEGGPPPQSMANAVSKIESIKNWSLKQIKCTRQILSERFGRGSRTVDLQLEAQIEVLRDTQRKYQQILRLARGMASHFYNVVQTQRALGDTFSDLAQKSPELQEEFTYNAETQKALCKNGETLLGAINFFTSNVNTLVNKTMEDTLLTIRQYEQARVEYDAYRTDLEQLQLGPKDAAVQARMKDADSAFQAHKDKFDRLRGDVAVKLKFLEENKVKVMHKQLLLFHNAISAYFAGNQTALEATLKQFNIKLKSPGEENPSWLEE